MHGVDIGLVTKILEVSEGCIYPRSTGADCSTIAATLGHATSGHAYIEVDEGKIMRSLIVLLVLLLIAGCTSGPVEPEKPPVATPPVATPPPSVPKPTPTPAPTVPGASALSKVTWKNSQWSGFVFEIVDSQFAKFEKASDIAKFCPRYKALDRPGRITVWVELVSQISLYESDWKPNSSMVETSMGTDPVTGVQVKSEGLLQLSYQDARNWSSIDACGKGISWSKKNIRDPFVNLDCGVRILARLIERSGVISNSSNKGGAAYWAVLRQGHKNFASIVKGVGKFPLCHKP